MDRILQIGGIVLLVIGSSFGADQKAPKEPPPAKTQPVLKAAPPNGGVVKGGLPKGAQRIVNPANAATRLFRMSPEQRERALEPLPPKQQENARKLLAWFDNLPKEQQDIQIRRLDHFSKLPPEKRAEVRQLVVAANQLPPPRKRIVGAELLRLQQMTDAQREATLNRPVFQARFSAEELRIITGLADAWMGPL